jgi:hypothetical protein
MRKITLFAAGFATGAVIGIGAWIGVGASSTNALAVSTVDPSAMMMDAKNLPASHYDDYSLVFIGP